MYRSFGWETVRQASIDILPSEEDDEISLPVPIPTTRETPLKCYLNIGGPILRETIEVPLNFPPTASAKQFLESVIARNSENLDTGLWTVSTLTQAARPEVTWHATLFNLLIQQLPSLQPRYYSIASSPVANKKRVASTVAVVITGIPSQKAGNRFYGLTTEYLYSVVWKEKRPFLQLLLPQCHKYRDPSLL